MTQNPQKKCVRTLLKVSSNKSREFSKAEKKINVSKNIPLLNIAKSQLLQDVL